MGPPHLWIVMLKTASLGGGMARERGCVTFPSEDILQGAKGSPLDPSDHPLGSFPKPQPLLTPHLSLALLCTLLKGFCLAGMGPCLQGWKTERCVYVRVNFWPFSWLDISLLHQGKLHIHYSTHFGLGFTHICLWPCLYLACSSHGVPHPPTSQPWKHCYRC